MKKIFSKIISTLLVVIIVFSGFILPTSAAETLPDNILESDVVSDLKAMGIDITKYKKDTTAEHARLLKFLEFGYDYNGDQSEYSLFLYVWNPTGQAIKLESALNRVTIQSRSVSNIEQSDWRKFRLEVVDVSDTPGYENVFYKLRVHPGVLGTLLKNVSKSLRVYEISEIELCYSSTNNAKSFTVGGTFTFTGYQPYHNSLRTAVNTLSCNQSDRTVIEIEIKPTTWKTETSAKGIGYANELFSVYFAIPNDIIRDYGNEDDDITKGLVQVDGTYDKHKINGLVVSDKDTYNTVKSSLGITVPDSSVPFSFYSDKNIYSSTQYSKTIYTNPYNIVLGENGYKVYDEVITYGDRAYRQINVLTSVLQGDLSDKKDFLSAASLRTSLYALWNEIGNPLYLESYFVGPILPGSELYGLGDDLSYTVSAKDSNGNYVDIADQIKVYSSNHTPTLWDRWFGNSLYNESSYDNIKSIQALNNASFLLNGVSKNTEYISNEFYVSERDVNDLISYVAANSVKNKTTYLMRFAVEDYYATDVSFGALSGKSGIYFEKTIFTNVDILTFTFENKSGGRVILPVAATPVDNVGEITPPTEPTNKIEDAIENIKNGIANFDALLDVLSTFRIIFLLVAFVVFFILFRWLCNAFGTTPSKVFGFLFGIVLLPFKLIGKLFDFGDSVAASARKSEEHRWKRQDRSKKEKVSKEKEENNNKTE